MLDTAILKQAPFFRKLTPEQLKDIYAAGEIVDIKAEEILFEEGDNADGMYVVMEGSLKIFRIGDGEKVVLNTVGVGAMLGEMALIDGGTRSAGIKAASASTLFKISREQFSHLLETAPKIALIVFESLVERVRHMNTSRIEEELNKLALQNKIELERHKAITLMIAGVAHEINTPLGIINTAVGFLKTELDSEAIQDLQNNPRTRETYEDLMDAARLIEGNIQKAHRLIQSFKNVTVSQVDDKKEEFELFQSVQETIDLFKINARQARLEVEIINNLPADQRIWLGYRGYLSQVLMNLLTNVERYAYPDGKGGRVEIGLEPTRIKNRPAFELSVRDFGVGIDPANLSKLFEDVFTTGKGRGGTGLGMIIIKNIITGPLQGTITVESEPNHGTCFRVIFPQEVK
jgi:signal transduction histidine kinase